MSKVTVNFSFELEVSESVEYVAMDESGCIWGYIEKPTFTPAEGEWCSSGRTLVLLHDSDDDYLRRPRADFSNAVAKVQAGDEGCHTFNCPRDTQ